MPNRDLRNTCVPRVELDHRAREARLRLEQAERLLVPYLAAKRSWLNRTLFPRSFGSRSRGFRGRGSVDQSAASFAPNFLIRGRPGAMPWFVRQDAVRDPCDRVTIAEAEDQGYPSSGGQFVTLGAKSARSRRSGPHRRLQLRRSSCRTSAMFGSAAHEPWGLHGSSAAARCRRPTARARRGSRAAAPRRLGLDPAAGPFAGQSVGVGLPRLRWRAAWVWVRIAPRLLGALC
jgi:hypothetical protein